MRVRHLANILNNIKLSRPDGAGLSYQLPVSLMRADGHLNPVGLLSDVEACLGESKTLSPKRAGLSGGALA